MPLEERTAIANREGADLFLSIHANASRNTAARGVETYFLSFASTPDAEAVAARENSASERAMHNLPDIVKAIALNNKLDESRDLASMVQDSMMTRLRRANKSLRNLGVKKAPFVVLIGAGMPSVLAEIAFLTNRPGGAAAEDRRLQAEDRRGPARRRDEIPPGVEAPVNGGGQALAAARGESKVPRPSPRGYFAGVGVS